MSISIYFFNTINPNRVRGTTNIELESRDLLIGHQAIHTDDFDRLGYNVLQTTVNLILIIFIRVLGRRLPKSLFQ